MGNFIIKGRITGWEYEPDSLKDGEIKFYLAPDQSFTVTYADKKYAIFIDSDNGNNAKQICFKEKLIINFPLPNGLDKKNIVTLEFSDAECEKPAVVEPAASGQKSAVEEAATVDEAAAVGTTGTAPKGENNTVEIQSDDNPAAKLDLPISKIVYSE